MDYPFTLIIDESKVRQLEMLATHYQRTQQHLLNEAVDRYLEDEAHHLQIMLASIEEANAGKLIPHEVAMQQLDQLLNELKCK